MKNSNINQIFIKISLTTICFICIITQSSCDTEELCNSLRLADLTIPSIVNALDQSGNPIISQTTGENIRVINELFYNATTNEYFNYDNPPSQGVVVGDLIQVATRVFNSFNEDDCTLGGDAEPTTTSADITISQSPNNLDGIYTLNAMPTPYIEFGNESYTFTQFEIPTPGFYSTKFEANKDRTIEEHSLENNLYNGQGGTNLRNTSFSFKAELSNESRKTSKTKTKNYTKNIKNIKELELYKFVNSNKYEEWILDSY